MAIGTYSELKTAVANWLARADLSDRIPEFIAIAEAKFNRILFVPQMEKRVTTTVDTASTDPEFISLPTDFQTMRRVRLNSVTGKPRLAFMSETQLDDYRYSTDNISAQPVYFAIVGQNMELAPTPDLNYTVEMVYRANIAALSDSNTTNWLLTAAPDAYLYGALLEAAIFTQTDERVSLWLSAFQGAIDHINGLGERAVYGASPSSITLPGVVP
jgi:hypothetical protein